jgi:hypothetical protein
LIDIYHPKTPQLAKLKLIRTYPRSNTSKKELNEVEPTAKQLTQKMSSLKSIPFIVVTKKTTQLAVMKLVRTSNFHHQQEIA